MPQDWARALGEQRALLRHAANSFDQGFSLAYLQIAVHVRTLVHDTRSSHSLLGQIGVKEQLVYATSGEVNPKNLATTMALTYMRMGLTAEGMVASYQPRGEQDLLEGPRGLRVVGFDHWWRYPVMKDSLGEEFSRSELVLLVANKQGGAHIDDVPERVRRLEEEGTLGWAIGSDDGDIEAVLASPVPPSIRTIASELLLSLHNQEELIASKLQP